MLLVNMRCVGLFDRWWVVVDCGPLWLAVIGGAWVVVVVAVFIYTVNISLYIYIIGEW